MSDKFEAKSIAFAFSSAPITPQGDRLKKRQSIDFPMYSPSNPTFGNPPPTTTTTNDNEVDAPDGMGVGFFRVGDPLFEKRRG